MNISEVIAQSVGRILGPLLIQIGYAAGFVVAVLIALVAVMGYFIGWDLIKRAIGVELESRAVRARHDQQVAIRRLRKKYPGFAVLMDGLEERYVLASEERRKADGIWHDDEHQVNWSSDMPLEYDDDDRQDGGGI